MFFFYRPKVGGREFFIDERQPRVWSYLPPCILTSIAGVIATVRGVGLKFGNVDGINIAWLFFQGPLTLSDEAWDWDGSQYLTSTFEYEFTEPPVEKDGKAKKKS